jgi:hypothetical protein
VATTTTDTRPSRARTAAAYVFPGAGINGSNRGRVTRKLTTAATAAGLIGLAWWAINR